MTGAPKPSLVLREVEGRLQVEVTNLSAVADAIGRPLFAALLKCLVGLDRIASLEQLLNLNHQHLHESSVAYGRNLRTLVFLLGGAVYELLKAIEALRRDGVAGRLATDETWRPLDTLRKKWNGDPRLSCLRNSLAHHFGEEEAFTKGVDLLAVEATWSPLIIGDTSARHDSQYPLALDALLRGVDLRVEDLDVVLRETQEAHTRLADLVEDLFLQVAAASGIETPRE